MPPLLAVRELRAGLKEEALGDEGSMGAEVLKGTSLEIGKGQVHMLLGKNGSGKSTLAHVLSGHPRYQVLGGSVVFDGRDLLTMEPEERANRGLFVGFQYPTEVPGLENRQFLLGAVNARRAFAGDTPMNPKELDALVAEESKVVGLDPSLLDRDVNVGFSGGEKKRNELLQMLVLQPTIAILDEIDSGLDVDGLAKVAAAIRAFRSPERSLIIITHYEKLIRMVEPDFVHVMHSGRVVVSGGVDIAKKIEEEGFAWVEKM